MKTARGLYATFLVWLLVARSCFADETYGLVQGRTLRMAHLQEQPGTGQFIFTKLPANAPLQVRCRLESSVVALDPWWLNAIASLSGETG